MKLINVKIKKYKSFLTEQEIDIDPEITRVVGKNESGKSALLEAIAKTRYFDGNDKDFQFDKELDYPRSELVRVRGNDPEAIECQYEIEEGEMERINEEFAPGILKNNHFTMTTTYDGKNTVNGFDTDFPVFRDWLAEDYIDEADEMRESILSAKSFSALYDKIEAEYKDDKETWEEIYKEVKKIKDKSTWNDSLSGYIYFTYIQNALPKFWYFSDYYSLPSRVNLTDFEAWKVNGKLPTDVTQDEYNIVAALFDLSGLTIEDLKDETNFEVHKAALEATSNSITDEMFEYWSTNKNLEIEFALEHGSKTHFLNIRVRNTIHRVSLPLKNRSKGFLWFFSFLVWFNRIQGDQSNNYVLLLDEPGLSLHASAQADLLRFIEERLATDYQVIYTTHSPFMIDTLRLDQVRTVYDTGDPKVGSVMSSALEERDADTLFPLQAALGYTLAQNLYVTKRNLLVEGISDYVYLSHFSAILNNSGRKGLSDKITIVPVGGAEKVATFISLMRGNELNCVCLLDTFNNQKAKANLDKMIRQKLIAEKKIIYADKYTSFEYSDVEDLFEKEEYLLLYNGAFNMSLQKTDIDDDKPIMGQLRHLNGDKDFNHYIPAKFMMENISEVSFSDETLGRFEKVLADVNKLLQ